MEFESSYFAFEGLSFALDTDYNCIIARTEIRLFEGTAYEVTVVGDDDFEQIVTCIDFKLFFYGFKAFWEKVEELVYLVESTGEKEGVVCLKSHLWCHRRDEFAIAVDFSEEEVVKIS